MDVNERRPEPFAGEIGSGTTWSESTLGAIHVDEKDEHQNEYDVGGVDVEEASPTSRNPRPLRRTRSLDNITPGNAEEKNYMVSFRMPHPSNPNPESSYNTNRGRTNAASDAQLT